MTSKLNMKNARVRLKRNFTEKCFKDFVFCPNWICLITEYKSRVCCSIRTPKVFITRSKD